MFGSFLGPFRWRSSVLFPYITFIWLMKAVLNHDPLRRWALLNRNNNWGRVWRPKRRCFCLLRVRPLVDPYTDPYAPYTDRLLLSSQPQSGHFKWAWVPCHPFHPVNIAINCYLVDSISNLDLILDQGSNPWTQDAFVRSKDPYILIKYLTKAMILLIDLKHDSTYTMC